MKRIALITTLVLISCHHPAAHATQHTPPRLLVVGNSITQHAPYLAGGWAGTWGMAASAPDRDFAHLLAARLGAELLAANVVRDWETRFTQPDGDVTAVTIPQDWRDTASVVVIRLGDNVQAEEYLPDPFLYGAAYRALIRAVRPPGAVLVCTSSYYRKPDLPGINEQMRAACEAEDGAWVNLIGMEDDPANEVASERAFPNTPEGLAVARHPGDVGMRRIYERIAAVIVAAQATLPPAPPIEITPEPVRYWWFLPWTPR